MRGVKRAGERHDVGQATRRGWARLCGNARADLFSSSSLGLAVKSPWPRKPQARAHRPRRSCLLVSSLRMRSTAVGVRMRAALPRVRTCAHGIFVSRRWRGSAPLNVGLLNAFGVLEGVEGGVRFHDEFHDEFHGWRREGACRGRRPDAFKCQGVQVSKTAASARRGRHAPHARSCSAHSHSDHDATYAQAAQQRS